MSHLPFYAFCCPSLYARLDHWPLTCSWAFELYLQARILLIAAVRGWDSDIASGLLEWSLNSAPLLPCRSSGIPGTTLERVQASRVLWDTLPRSWFFLQLPNYFLEFHETVSFSSLPISFLRTKKIIHTFIYTIKQIFNEQIQWPQHSQWHVDNTP